ncbi:MAG TPA: hypothetical protein VGE88_15885 [Lysobacter sp.]
MCDRERRQQTPGTVSALRAQLNEDQKMALCELERFGWELRFIRRPLFQEAIPVVADGDRKSYSVLMPDGSLEGNPRIKIRV